LIFTGTLLQKVWDGRILRLFHPQDDVDFTYKIALNTPIYMGKP